MYDERPVGGVDDTHLVEVPCVVWPMSMVIASSSASDRIGVGERVADGLFGYAVFVRARRDARLIHRSKLPCRNLTRKLPCGVRAVTISGAVQISTAPLACA